MKFKGAFRPLRAKPFGHITVMTDVITVFRGLFLLVMSYSKAKIDLQTVSRKLISAAI